MVPAILPAKWCFAEDLKSDIPDVPAIRLSGRMDGRLKSPPCNQKVCSSYTERDFQNIPVLKINVQCAGLIPVGRKNKIAVVGFRILSSSNYVFLCDQLLFAPPLEKSPARRRGPGQEKTAGYLLRLGGGGKYVLSVTSNFPGLGGLIKV
jgi:hypothetical protein